MTFCIPVNPKGLPARSRVCTNNRMDTLNVLRSLLGVFAVEVRVGGSVDTELSVNDLTEVGGELLVGGVAAGPQRITTGRGDGVIVQVGVAGRVPLVDQVGVPPGRTAGVPEAGLALRGHQVGPDETDTGYTRYLRNQGLKKGKERRKKKD